MLGSFLRTGDYKELADQAGMGQGMCERRFSVSVLCNL